MNVAITSFNVEMAVKNKGIELEVHEPGGKKKLGDLVITKTHLIWCEGQTRPENGKKIKWTNFIEMVNADSAPAKKTRAKKAAKKAAVKPIAPATEPTAE
jgi:hypothetical protein